MDRGEIPTPVIPIQSIGWVREGRGLRTLGRGILVFCFATVANLGPIPTTNEAPVPMDGIG